MLRVRDQGGGRAGAGAHNLARAHSELEAAQRFVEPVDGGETDLALARALANARANVADAMETVRKTPGKTMDRSSSGSRFYSPECVDPTRRSEVSLTGGYG